MKILVRSRKLFVTTILMIGFINCFLFFHSNHFANVTEVQRVFHQSKNEGSIRPNDLTFKKKPNMNMIPLPWVQDRTYGFTNSTESKAPGVAGYHEKISLLKQKIASMQHDAPNIKIYSKQDFEDCYPTEDDEKYFPDCVRKIEYMQTHWKNEGCYRKYGTNGNICSARHYLSQYEYFCPPLKNAKERNIPTSTSVLKTSLNFDLTGLLHKLESATRKGAMNAERNYAWIKERLTLMWPMWVQSSKALSEKQQLENVQVKRVWLHIGMASHKHGFKMAAGALQGGSLGELVQWSDVMASFYILGHDVTITSEYYELLPQRLGTWGSSDGSICQSLQSIDIDVIVTDGVGWWGQLQRRFSAIQSLLKCKLWILDSFGTEPSFNHREYAMKNDLITEWGMLYLEPRQFFTLYPHTPDNSFMGFVVNLPGHTVSTSRDFVNASDIESRDHIALVYGKDPEFWVRKAGFIQTVNKSIEIHGTIDILGSKKHAFDRNVPSYVINHGRLGGAEIHTLLHKIKLFIGLGFPYDGPAPLEAIAHGAVFINPKFKTPHGRHNNKFYAGKPTSRTVGSQNPYCETVIGPPHVRTIDIENNTEVHEAVVQAINDVDSGKVHGFLPYEFTGEGMLQRVHYYAITNNFCNTSQTTVPEIDIEYVTSELGQSCIDSCSKRNLICERIYFERLNTVSMLEKHFKHDCQQNRTRNDTVIYPAMSASNDCVLQGDPLLFSCADASLTYYRLCPCRNFIKDQSALCEHCVN